MRAPVQSPTASRSCQYIVWKEDMEGMERGGSWVLPEEPWGQYQPTPHSWGRAAWARVCVGQGVCGRLREKPAWRLWKGCTVAGIPAGPR